MKRIFAILMACLFMMAAMAVTASTAFARPPAHGCVNKAEPPWKDYNCFHKDTGGG